jgi:hypothetical protein
MTAGVQVVVLAAGAPPGGETVAIGSRLFDRRQTVLEWQLHALGRLTSDIQVVVGYDLQVGQHPPVAVRLRVNRDWASTGSVASLLTCDLDLARPLLVCYGDLLFHPAALDALAASEADIRVAVDAASRAQARPTREAVVVEEAGPSFGTLADLHRSDAFLCGLFWFSAAALARIQRLDLAGSSLTVSHISGLLALLRQDRSLSFDLVEVGSQVVDLDEERAVSRFVFGTKAETLARLQGKLSHGVVMPQVSFTTQEWFAHGPRLVEEVLCKFKAQQLIVRSSAASEDQFTGSLAGRFDSVLGVVPEVSALTSAVDRVIESFEGEPDASLLVQPMVTGVVLSGVVLTRTLGRGAPYYVVNFTESSETNLVTGGHVLPKRAYLHRGASIDLLDAKLQPVMRLVQEVERMTDLDALDLEFAVDADSTVYLLQVRPLATSTDHGAETDQLVADALERARLEFLHLAEHRDKALGQTAVFGVMPDWNPAEIIGEVPRPLAFDLYRELVTDWAWAQQRHEFGYRDLRGQPLLRSFCGRAYVDVRASFTSFAPASLPEPLAERLVEAALQRLVRHPALHDKVEFEVMPTCLDLMFTRWDEQLFSAAGLSVAETRMVEQAYREVTVHAWAQVDESLAAVRRFEAELDVMWPPAWSRASVLALLHRCRDEAVLHFAHLARCAFIAVALLRTAVARGLLAQSRADEFLASIHTVAHQFRDDVYSTSIGLMSRDELLKRYSHLRPGTYDVSVPSYAEAPESMLWPLLDGAVKPADIDFKWTSSEARALSDALVSVGLPHDANGLATFMRDAIRGREYGKFVFSRVLSSFLSWTRREASAQGVSPHDIAHLGLGEVLLGLKGASALAPHELLSARIGVAKRGMAVSLMLELPQLIFDPAHFSGYAAGSVRPNFVAHGVVMAPVLLVSGYTDQSLDGRLVLVESADPGYDWLFAHRLGGLVTAYGGANSHMAIRCAELGLPAAIGVGPVAFKQMAKAAVLRLDCDARRLEVVR